MEELKARAGVDKKRAAEVLHKADLIKMEYESLQKQADVNRNDAAADNRKAADDSGKADRAKAAAETKSQ